MEQYLVKKARQTVWITIKSTTFEISLFPINSVMYISVRTSPNDVIVASRRIVANEWLLPSYKVISSGNFRFEVYSADADEYVWYDGFNDKFRFCWYTNEEIAEMER